jgi:Uma2 family endonuclease
MSTIVPAHPTMSVIPSALAPPAAHSFSELYRLTVDQYEQMGRAGIFSEDDRVELVEGLLYRKPMKKGPHSIVSRETAAALSRLVRSEAYFVTREDPVRIPGRSGMPEPDISVSGAAREIISNNRTPVTFRSSSRFPTKPLRLTARTNLAHTPGAVYPSAGSSTS